MPELIKRFTSAGTGPGQGGIPGHNLPLLTARLTASGTTPKPTHGAAAPCASLSGHLRRPPPHHDKRTPVHDAQVAAGGIFRRIGVWERARYFSDGHDCRDEILNVRTNVGLLDASTLGKFRLHGPDALKALQRVYVSDMHKISPRPYQIFGHVQRRRLCHRRRGGRPTR